MSNKFKVGDKVVANKEANRHYNVTIKGWQGIVTGFKYGLMEVKEVDGVNRYNVSPQYFDLVKDANTRKIVITTKDDETVAELYENEMLVKIATAKCSPDDTFDLGTGAKIAIDRLMRNVEKEFTPHLEAVGRCYGVLGTPTKYKDILGKELFVGDTVSVFDDNGRMITETPIVDTKEGGQFVMGIERDCDKEAGTTGEWEILKSHSYEDIKDGTHVNFVTYIK